MLPPLQNYKPHKTSRANKSLSEDRTTNRSRLKQITQKLKQSVKELKIIMNNDVGSNGTGEQYAQSYGKSETGTTRVEQKC